MKCTAFLGFASISTYPIASSFSILHDTLAWATGTRVGAGDHAIALFCIGCGRVLGFLYFDTLILWLIVRINGRTIIYVVVMLRSL